MAFQTGSNTATRVRGASFERFRIGSSSSGATSDPKSIAVPRRSSAVAACSMRRGSVGFHTPSVGDPFDVGATHASERKSILRNRFERELSVSVFATSVSFSKLVTSPLSLRSADPKKYNSWRIAWNVELCVFEGVRRRKQTKGCVHGNLGRLLLPFRAWNPLA